MRKTYSIMMVLEVEAEFLTEAILVSEYIQRYAHDQGVEVKVATVAQKEMRRW